MSIISQINMTPGGETSFMSLNNSPILGRDRSKEPTPRHVAHSMQSIMSPLEQAEISFIPHAVLGYSTSVQSSTSIETDISCADVSSLPLSVCSAGDMSQPDDQPRDYESAMGGMTLDSASSTGTGEQDIEDMEKNPEVETEDRVNKE